MPLRRSWRAVGGDWQMTQHISAVSRLVRSLYSQFAEDPHHLAGARTRSWISTVAVKQAERTTLGGTSLMWMRTGMRCACAPG
jgi:hypothetical protein